MQSAERSLGLYKKYEEGMQRRKMPVLRAEPVICGFRGAV